MRCGMASLLLPSWYSWIYCQHGAKPASPWRQFACHALTRSYILIDRVVRMDVHCNQSVFYHSRIKLKTRLLLQLLVWRIHPTCPMWLLSVTIKVNADVCSCISIHLHIFGAYFGGTIQAYALSIVPECGEFSLICDYWNTSCKIKKINSS